MRETNRLSAVEVAAKRKPGRYGDGLNLWLEVRSDGGKSWLFRYKLDGKARHMGLGPLHTVTLAEAREAAAACRKLLLKGIDPIEARRTDRQAARLDSARMMTFTQCAQLHIKAHAPGWRNAKHADQWEATLAAYAYPVFGELAVSAVDTGLVLKALQPIWTSKTETAARLRGRIERILDWAAARGYRAGDNPARWRGHLDKLLPAKTKVSKDKHFAALPYGEVGGFMEALRLQPGTGARALEFAILTGSRTGEVIRAKWSEIDRGESLWIIPAERMKAGREHRVPLSRQAIAILERLPVEGDYVFPGGRAQAPLSQMALLAVLRRMNRRDLTVHGFRSSFRDWAAETTAFPNEVVELALAHTVADKVEAAYRRGDLFAKRRRLMDAWAKFCAKLPAAAGQVVPLRGKR